MKYLIRASMVIDTKIEDIVLVDCENEDAAMEIGTEMSRELIDEWTSFMDEEDILGNIYFECYLMKDDTPEFSDSDINAFVKEWGKNV